MAKAGKTVAQMGDEKDCEALHMLRLMQQHADLINGYETAEFSAPKDRDDYFKFKNAGARAYQMSQMFPQALALTEATSLKGAVAKMILAAYLWEGAGDMPSEWASKQDKLAGRLLLEDAMRFFKERHGFSYRDIGLARHENSHLETGSLYIEADEALERAKSAKK